jgi:hypothetical protein
MAIEYPVVWRLLVKDNAAAWQNFGQIVSDISGMFSFARKYLEVQPVDTTVMRRYPIGFDLQKLEFTVVGFDSGVYDELLNSGERTILAESNGLVDPSSGTFTIRGVEMTGYLDSHSEDFTGNKQSVKISFQPNSMTLFTRVAAVRTVIMSLPGSGVALPAMPT